MRSGRSDNRRRLVRGALARNRRRGGSAPYQAGAGGDWFVERTTTLLPFCNYYNEIGIYSMRSYTLAPQVTRQRIRSASGPLRAAAAPFRPPRAVPSDVTPAPTAAPSPPRCRRKAFLPCWPSLQEIEALALPPPDIVTRDSGSAGHRTGRPSWVRVFRGTPACGPRRHGHRAPAGPSISRRR